MSEIVTGMTVATLALTGLKLFDMGSAKPPPPVKTQKHRIYSKTRTHLHMSGGSSVPIEKLDYIGGNTWHVYTAYNTIYDIHCPPSQIQHYIETHNLHILDPPSVGAPTRMGGNLDPIAASKYKSNNCRKGYRN